MAHFFFNFSLELCYPKACPPRNPDDPFLYMYTCDLHLLGPKMTVLVPVPAAVDGTGPMYAHGTRAQIMGPGDVAGHTIYLRQPSVVPCEQPSSGRPFVLFKAAVTAWTWEVFTATVAGRARWPPPKDVACLYDQKNEHLRDLDYVEEGTVITVSGHLLGSADDCLDFEVHDVSLEPGIPPCNAGGFANPSIHTPGAREGLCQWFATYYPYAKPVNPVVADAATVTHSPASEEPGAASGNGSARCTSADAASIRLALEQAFAFRDEGPIGQTPVDPRFRYDTPSEPETESELHWLRGPPMVEQPIASPAYADASAHQTPSAAAAPSAVAAPSTALERARLAYRGTPSDVGPDADWEFAGAARDTSSARQPSAVSSAYGSRHASSTVEPSIAVSTAHSAIRERIVSSKYGAPLVTRPQHDIIDLTQDSTDEDVDFEPAVGGVKRCKWLAESTGSGRTVSCP